MKYKTIRKHYKEGDFHFDKKSKHWISKDGKLKLQDGDMYFLFDAEDKNYDKLVSLIEKDFNKRVFINNINKFIKEIRNIPPNWFEGEKSKLRMFVEYLSTDGLTILEDCKRLIK